jgi:hypothetical protein
MSNVERAVRDYFSAVRDAMVWLLSIFAALLAMGVPEMQIRDVIANQNLILTIIFVSGVIGVILVFAEIVKSSDGQYLEDLHMCLSEAYVLAFECGVVIVLITNFEGRFVMQFLLDVILSMSGR